MSLRYRGSRRQEGHGQGDRASGAACSRQGSAIAIWLSGEIGLRRLENAGFKEALGRVGKQDRRVVLCHLTLIVVSNAVVSHAEP